MLTLTMLFLVMKKLFRKIFRNTALLLVLAGGMGCSADIAVGDVAAPDMEGYVTTFGEIFGEEHKILTDDGLELYILDVAESISWSELREMRGRVLLNYSIVGTSIHENLFLIKVNRFYPLVVSDVEILEAKGAEGDVSRSAGPNNNGGFDVKNNPDFVSLPDVPAMPYEVGVGGGYINIYVFYYSTTADYVPEVSLVWDVATSTADTALFQLVGGGREEAYAPEAKRQYMWHTFYVGEEIAERIKGVNNYAFYWRWWADEGNRQKGVKDYTSIMTNPSLGGSSSRRVIGYMQ